MKLKVISLVSLLALAGAACGNSTPTSGGTTIVAPSSSSGSMAPTVQNQVNANDQLKFDPPTLLVKKGGKVTWKNVGTAPHTVTFTTIKFDKNLNQGGSVSFVFKKAGVFSYVCKIHVSSGMKGTIVVKG